MCKHAVISLGAAPRRVESARGVGNWRRPVCGSSGAVIIVGLIHCGQRGDLELVVVAIVVVSVRSVRRRSSIHLPLLLRGAVVGIIADVVACIGSAHTSVVLRGPCTVFIVGGVHASNARSSCA